MKLIATWLVTILVPSLCCQAAVARDKGQAEGIRSVMKSRDFLSPLGTSAFCRGFLDDFKEQIRIEYATPRATAVEEADPVLSPYTKRCPQLNRIYSCEPKIWDALQKLDEQERQSRYETSCSVYQGTTKLQIFELEGVKPASEFKPLVIYLERSFGPINRSVQPAFADGAYKAVDSRTCRALWESAIRNPYDRVSGKPLANFNGLISYKGQSYVFDLYQLGSRPEDRINPHYRLRLDGYDGSRWKPLCAFSTVPPAPGVSKSQSKPAGTQK